MNKLKTASVSEQPTRPVLAASETWDTSTTAWVWDGTKTAEVDTMIKSISKGRESAVAFANTLEPFLAFKSGANCSESVRELLVKISTVFDQIQDS